MYNKDAVLPQYLRAHTKISYLRSKEPPAFGGFAPSSPNSPQTPIISTQYLIAILPNLGCLYKTLPLPSQHINWACDVALLASKYKNTIYTVHQSACDYKPIPELSIID